MIAVLSQGCAANFGDGEKIAKLLSQGNIPGPVIFEFPSTAPHVFYLNVCTVKGNATAIKLIRKAHETYPLVPIFVTGCTTKDLIEEVGKSLPQVKFTSLKDLCHHSIFKISEQKVLFTNTLRASNFTGIVNIEEGCLDACAFCSTHLVKGRLRSFPEPLILEQVKRLVLDGCKEIQLTGQDCGCYGFDTGTNLAQLVQNILVHVPGDYKIRLGMGNPRHVLQYKDQLLECFQDERVYKFMHLPVQSGSEKVLQLMNRRHTVQDYADLAGEIYKRFSRFTLSTDLIVGFPGETDKDFEQTLNILRQTRPTVCNITRFVSRPQTPAARFAGTSQEVPDSLKHIRSARLSEEFQKIALENNRQWIGWKGSVVMEKSGYREGTSIGRNFAFRPVAIATDLKPGKKIQVTITDAEPFALIGQI
ncbi:MAG: MiaB/RimO family radical SAM methylthiotransferase [Fibrobacteraceae bacterium]|nr:MiaB/RimO family radical SAM methylthiotransferase [Fibrobacteraceae bacterium]